MTMNLLQVIYLTKSFKQTLLSKAEETSIWLGAMFSNPDSKEVLRSFSFCNCSRNLSIYFNKDNFQSLDFLYIGTSIRKPKEIELLQKLLLYSGNHCRIMTTRNVDVEREKETRSL